MVSAGLNGSGKRHRFATNDTNLPQPKLQFSTPALERCQQVKAQVDYHGALSRLDQLDGALWRGDLNLQCSDKELRAFAERKAERIRQYIQHWRQRPKRMWTHIRSIGACYDITLPDQDKPIPATETLLKLSTAHWWLRQLRTMRRRVLDNVARDLNFVQNAKLAYCSGQAMQLFKHQIARNQAFMEQTTLINECGDEISLAEIAEHSPSNPVVRRAELMVRIRGFEEVANFLGDDAMFYTLTAPSRFHASLHNGAKNPKHNGKTVRDAQRWLQTSWAQVRAKLDRDHIQYYGFRVAEPHHDGTPHWHFLLFVNPKHKNRLNKIFRRYALREIEPGAEQHRLKIEEIDRSKGSAVGYIAKYISKNIDGEFLEKDLHGNDAKESAARITAWARTHNIRQFQQIGGPSVTVWRELRRLRDPIKDNEMLEEARQAADTSAWAAYVLVMGGVAMRRADRPIKLAKAYREEINTQTGEITVADKTWYGGKRAMPIRGVECNGKTVITRIHEWIATRKAEVDLSGGLAARRMPGNDPPGEFSSRREAPLGLV